MKVLLSSPLDAVSNRSGRQLPVFNQPRSSCLSSRLHTCGRHYRMPLRGVITQMEYAAEKNTNGIFQRVCSEPICGACGCVVQ